MPEIRPGIRRLFRLAVRRPDRAADEMDDEIRLHLALRTEQLIAQGLHPDAARREAEARFGVSDGERLRASATRREGRLRLGERGASAWRAVRLAVRSLARAPGFVAVATTCIALGVGAN